MAGKIAEYLRMAAGGEVGSRRSGVGKTVRLCLVSDIHTSGMGSVDAKDADVVVIAGDFMGGGNESDGAGAEYLLGRFFPWCRANAGRDVVVTAGNHDKFLYRMWERRGEIRWPGNVHYLVDEGKMIRGLRFYGTPWCGRDRDGRFELDGRTLDYMFRKIPEKVDVLVSHVPPRVGGSGIDWSDWSGEHEGSAELTAAIEEKKPRLVVCGHVHGGDRSPCKVGESEVLNVSRVADDRSEAAYGPVFVDMDVRQG